MRRDACTYFRLSLRLSELDYFLWHNFDPVPLSAVPRCARSRGDGSKVTTTLSCADATIPLTQGGPGSLRSEEAFRRRWVYARRSEPAAQDRSRQKMENETDAFSKKVSTLMHRLLRCGAVFCFPITRLPREPTHRRIQHCRLTVKKERAAPVRRIAGYLV